MMICSGEAVRFHKRVTIRQGKMLSVYCDYNIYGMLREDYAKTITE